MERQQKVTGVFGDVRMEAESAFPGLFSDFEAERFTSGVELPQSQTYKFEDLETAEGDEDGALSYDVQKHNSRLALFGFRTYRYYAPDPRKYRI